MVSVVRGCEPLGCVEGITDGSDCDQRYVQGSKRKVGLARVVGSWLRQGEARQRARRQLNGATNCACELIAGYCTYLYLDGCPATMRHALHALLSHSGCFLEKQRRPIYLQQNLPSV